MTAKPTDSKSMNDIHIAANKANLIYWDLHALLHGASMIAQSFDDDAVELQILIGLASGKALELQTIFDPYVTRKVAATAIPENALGRA